MTSFTSLLDVLAMRHINSLIRKKDFYDRYSIEDITCLLTNVGGSAS